MEKRSVFIPVSSFQVMLELFYKSESILIYMLSHIQYIIEY